MHSEPRSTKTLQHVIVVFAILFALLVAGSSPLPACPFCPGPQMTLTEHLAQAEAATLVQWVGGEKDTADSAGTSIFLVKQVVKGPKSLVEDQKVTLDRYRVARSGDLFLLLGTDLGEGKGLEWDSPLEVSEASFNYIIQAPSPEAPADKRLAYFLKFIEFSDPVVSNDAFGEFANAPFKDVEQLAPQFPKEKIRKWIENPETQATRLGLYGMMLGLCGDDSDAAMLEKRILAKGDDGYRLGIDGLIGGYLLIKKDKGLDVLDKRVLQNKQMPFPDVFAAMQALRFMWTYGEGRIAPARLQQSMRLLLDRSEMTDLVIADLARWKDWTLQDKLMKQYGQGEFNIPSVKRAIIRYMLVSSKDIANGGGVRVPAHVTHGLALLKELRKKDPKTVADAERYFLEP